MRTHLPAEFSRALGGSPNHISASGLVPVEELGERGPNCLVRQLLAAGWNIFSVTLVGRSDPAMGSVRARCTTAFVIFLSSYE